MRFIFTMNMPTKNGALVHSVIADHHSDCLDTLFEAISTSDFLLVDEFYSNSDRMTGANVLTPHGQIILNSMHIGKVKKLEERQTY